MSYIHIERNVGIEVVPQDDTAEVPAYPAGWSSGPRAAGESPGFTDAEIRSVLGGEFCDKVQRLFATVEQVKEPPQPDSLSAQA